MYTMTDTEAAGIAGGLLGLFAGLAIALVFFGIIWYVLMIIAWWKIFTKAGEAGWKSLIPIYNLWVAYKITGVAPWLIFVPFISGLISGLATDPDGHMAPIMGFICILLDIISVVIYIYYSFRLAKVFGKGTVFAILTIFFPNIMGLILGFGKAKYSKKALKN